MARRVPVPRGRTHAYKTGRLTAGRAGLAVLAAGFAAGPILACGVASPASGAPSAAAFAIAAAAIAAGLASALALRASRLRSAATARRVSGALALHACAIGWGIRLSERGVLESAASWPAHLWERVAATPPELFLLHVGLIALVMASALVSVRALFALPHCLICASRCRPLGESVECAAPPLEMIQEVLEARDWTFFRPLGPPSRRGHGLRFRLHSCRCGLTACFDLILLRPFWFGRALARLRRLFPDELRALAQVTHDILHPPRAADWLIPTRVRIDRAVEAEGQLSRSVYFAPARAAEVGRRPGL